jgi:outer membrane receptor protein involved in Fe transport
LFVLGGGSALALLFAAAPNAFGQDAASAPGVSEEIVVTGSHIARSTFNAPTPVNVVGDERMKALAIPNVADALNQIPSFRAITTPATSLFRVSGSIGGRSVDLRGLGPTRTLVLVDGKRMVPTSDNGTTDLNGIPSALVARSEIVTGGASAAYGADAVAGVVNLILDNKFTGVKSDLSAGVSGHGDAVNYFASVAGGQDFAGGRGHVIGALEYQNEQGVGPCYKRDFCKKFTNYYGNPGYIGGVSTNGLPANLVRDNVLFLENPTGVLLGTASGTTTKLQQLNNNTLAAALKGKQFSADGQSLVPFQFGQLNNGNFQIGGDSSIAELYGLGNVPLVTPTNHTSAFVHADFDVTDTITASVEGMFNHVMGGPVISTYFQVTPTAASAVNTLKLTTGQNGLGNPYINPAIRAQVLAADPTADALIVDVSKPETGDNVISRSRNDTTRIVLGLKGELVGDWKWDTSYEYGKTDGYVLVKHTRLAAIDNQALNAVTPPVGYTGPVYRTPTGAPVICNSSATNPADGCIPVNILGLNSVSGAAIDKYYKDEWQTRDITQHAFAANVNGTIVQGWAGPISGAVGAEWREDSAEGSVDALTAAGLFAAPQVTALPKVLRDVTEGYVETSIPLLTDLPFAKNLTIDAAKRWTHYSTSGDASAWKAGLVYEPDEQVLVRLTQSSDIRAPTAAELNPNSIRTNLPLADPFDGNAQHLVVTVNGGNPNLNLEEADTRTGGIVLKPNFIPGLRLSSDYYLIKVSQAIDTLSASTIMSACFQQNLLCNLITFTGAPKASQVATVFANFQNLSTLRAEGVEMVANYSFKGLGGDVDLSLNGNYIMDLRSIGATGLVTKLDGVTGNAGSLTNILGVPQYKLDAVATYSRDNWSLTAHGRYVPESILDPTKIGPDDSRYNINLSNSVETNRVDSRFYLDLSGTISPTAKIFGAKMQIYGAVNNVFDTEEPDQLRLFGNPLQYDVVGRAFRLGVRSNW